MGFTALLNRGAVTPEFNFLHRGVIPPGAGIGHHFYNTVEEMFVILDGEAQFTIDGRTATVKGPAGVICRTGHSHAIYNASSTPVQWMNLNVSLTAGVYLRVRPRRHARYCVARPGADVHDTAPGSRAAPRAWWARTRGRSRRSRRDAVHTPCALGPSVFSTTWAYVDHVLVPAGGLTPELAHESVGEAYYVLAGSGTLTGEGPGVGDRGVTRWRRDPDPHRENPISSPC